MTGRDPTSSGVPRLEYLRVRNYRALRDLELRDITPPTVFLGPNGSGKSTLFDVFAFLSECFTDGLRRAGDRRGRFKKLRTRGADGPIVFEIKYRERPGAPLITYHLGVDENLQGPYIAEEFLRWRRGQYGKPWKFLDFRNGSGEVWAGETADERSSDERIVETLASPEMIAVNTLGQFSRHPRVSALRGFITGWYLSYLSADSTRGVPEAGPQERLSKTGDNLANVMQYLREQHPERLEVVLQTLRERVPRLEEVDAQVMPDGRLLLQVKDAPFDRPIMARFASDGTLKLLSYLTVLYDPSPPRLVGIEEPENHLHPRLLPELAEECMKAAARTQMLVTTHSPFFVNGVRAGEVWTLYRDQRGYTQAKSCAEMERVVAMLDSGALLGDLWVEGFFDVGDPLTNAGGPKTGPAQALMATL